MIIGPRYVDMWNRKELDDFQRLADRFPDNLRTAVDGYMAVLIEVGHGGNFTLDEKGMTYEVLGRETIFIDAARIADAYENLGRAMQDVGEVVEGMWLLQEAAIIGRREILDGEFLYDGARMANNLQNR